MASKHFKKFFALRFISYFVSILGFASIFFQFGPIVQAEFGYRIDQLVGEEYSLEPTVITSNLNSPTPAPSGSTITTTPQPSAVTSGGGFGSIKSNAKIITPVSTDYGIVIEKIKANAKVISDVDPANEKQYIKALSEGVAEAKGSTKPGEPGNLYIFSNSTDAPWNIIRYNAIFYLLREMEPGDRVVMFYQGRRYDYIVFDKTIVDPKDTTLLRNRYDKPVITLQTCDPPGTLNNRLVVRAKLLGS